MVGQVVPQAGTPLLSNEAAAALTVPAITCDLFNQRLWMPSSAGNL